MNTVIRHAAIGLAAAWLAVGAPAAQDSVARADASFMREAAGSGLAVVEASKVAVVRAANAQVKGFAQQMIDEHDKLNDELEALAASKNVELPGEPGLMDKARIRMLGGADGASFDRRYAEAFGVKAHEKALRLFQKQSKNAKDPDLKAWVDKTLPALQHHLKTALELKTAVDKDNHANASGK